MPKRVKANGKTFTFDDNVTDEQIGNAIDEYFNVKKKEVSKPISQKKPLESNIPTPKQVTSLATEEPKQAQASDGLSGPPKMKEFTGFTKEEQQKMQSPPKPATTLPTPEQIKATAGKPVKEMISQYADISKKRIVDDIKQKIFSVDQDKIAREIADEESKNQGFIGGLKQGATDFLNTLASGMNKIGLIDETGDLKLPKPFEKELQQTDKTLPYEQRLAQAKEIFAKERAKNQIDLNAESILSSTDPYVQEALKTESIKNLKANPKDKAIALQIQLINHDLDEIKNNPTPENLQKVSGLKAKHDYLVREYDKNKYNLSPEDQVKLFSLNYGGFDKFTGDLTAGLGRTVYGGGFNLLGEGAKIGVKIAESLGIHTEEGEKIKKQNQFSEIGENYVKGAEAESAKYRQVSLSDIVNSPKPINEFGRWVGQTINGVATFALPFAFGEGEANVLAKAYIGASGAGNKIYEINKENKDFKIAAADAYAKGYDKFEFDGKEYDTKKEKGKDLYSDFQKLSIATGYGLLDTYMAGGRLSSLKGGAKAMEAALGENIAKEQFENGLKGSLAEAKGVAGSILSKANHSGVLFAKVEAAKMFLDEKILDKKIEDPIDRIAQAYTDGVAMDALMQGAPLLFGYVVGKVSPNKNVVEIKNNTNKILEYEKALENANEQDKEIINSSIKELNDKNYSLVMKAYNQTRGMTPKQIEALLDIEKQKINIKKDAEYIRSEESQLDPSNKKEILKGLKSKFAELENNKIDIFNNEFSALKVLDEKEQNRLKDQATKELGEKANEDLINRRAIEIHRVELAKEAKQAKPVAEEKPIEEKSVPLHETLEGIKDMKYKKDKIEFVNTHLDSIIKELGLETKNCE